MSLAARTRREARSAFALDLAAVDWHAGVRLGLAVAVPLFVGLAYGREEAATLATLGALNTVLADPGGPWIRRFTTTLAAAFVLAIAMACATAASETIALAVLVAGLAGFGAGLTVEFGESATGVGFVTSILVVLGLGLPAPASDALPRAGWVLLGGGWGVVVSAGLWPFRPWAPLRGALADAYTATASFLRDVPHDPIDRAGAQDRVTTAVNGAREAAVHVRRRRQGLGALESWVARALKGVIEVEPLLGALDRAFADLPRVPPEVSTVLTALVTRCEEVAADPTRFEDLDTRALESAIEPLRARSSASPAVDMLLRVGDALSGRARTYAAASTVARRQRGRLADVAEARISPLFDRRSLVLRHALRLGVAVSVAQVLASADPLENGYWIPLTVVIILKPDLGSTLDRSAQRMAGTVLGALVAFGLADLLAGSEWALATAVVATSIAIGVFVRVNYGLAVLAITPCVILLLNIGGGTADLAWVRVVSTLAGGLLTLLAAYTLWPSWERLTLESTLAGAARSEAEYLDGVLQGGDVGPVRRAHHAAERDRSNAEASLQRMLSEPSSRWVSPEAVLDFCQRIQSQVERTTVVRIRLLELGRSPTADSARAVTGTRAALAPVVSQLHSVSKLLEGNKGADALFPDVRDVDAHDRVLDSVVRQMLGDGEGLRRAATSIRRASHSHHSRRARERRSSPSRAQDDGP